MNARYRRVVLGCVLSVVTLAWCVASAHSDNQRWVRNLHQGHQSPEFRKALTQIRASAGGSALDECSVCHGTRGWVPTLLDQRPPVSQDSCRRCHEAVPAGATPPGKSAAGVPWLGERLNRPAHWGIDYQGDKKVVGLPANPERHILCGDCHTDHRGTKLVDTSTSPAFHDGDAVADAVPVERPEEGKPPVTRFRFTRVCAPCHLPTTPSPEATRVLKSFLDGHKGDFEPAIPDAVAKAITEAPEGQPMQAATESTPAPQATPKKRNTTKLPPTYEEGPEHKQQPNMKSGWQTKIGD